MKLEQEEFRKFMVVLSLLCITFRRCGFGLENFS
jgi:hypothetical protein